MSTYVITLTVTGHLEADDAARIRDVARIAAQKKADSITDYYGKDQITIETHIEKH